MSYSINRTRKLENLNWSAGRWELFTGMDGADAAAKDMNQSLMDAVNAGCTRDEVEGIMNTVCERYSDLGAEDSEPQYHLAVLLDEIFGA